MITPSKRTYSSRVFTATIMKVVYGIELRDADHRYVKVAEDAMHAIAVAGVPGAFLVDILPAREFACHRFLLYSC